MADLTSESSLAPFKCLVSLSSFASHFLLIFFLFGYQPVFTLVFAHFNVFHAHFAFTSYSDMMTIQQLWQMADNDMSGLLDEREFAGFWVWLKSSFCYCPFAPRASLFSCFLICTSCAKT